jgi:hypothetical protein
MDYTFTTDPKVVGGDEPNERASTKGLAEAENVEIGLDNTIRPKYVPSRSQLLFGGDARRMSNTGGSTVRFVPDTGEKQNGLVQPNSGSQPRFESEINGDLPVIRFDRANSHYLEIDCGKVAQPYHFFALLRFNELPLSNKNRDRWIFADKDGQVFFGIHSVDIPDTSRHDIRLKSQAGKSYEETSGTIDKSFMILSALFYEDSSTIRVNGSAQTAESPSTPHSVGSHELNGFTLGGNGGSRNAGIDVVEYLFYPNNMNGSVDQIEKYLDRDTNILP